MTCKLVLVLFYQFFKIYDVNLYEVQGYDCEPNSLSIDSWTTVKGMLLRQSVAGSYTKVRSMDSIDYLELF